MVAHQQRLEDILDFWFRGSDDPNEIGMANMYDRETSLPKQYMVRWFKGNQQFDALVRSNFLDDFKKLDKGQFKEWEKDHYGRLALIILCDQLSRFCYRQ